MSDHKKDDKIIYKDSYSEDNRRITSICLFGGYLDYIYYIGECIFIDPSYRASP